MIHNPFHVPAQDRTLEDWRAISRAMQSRDNKSRRMLAGLNRQLNSMQQELDAYFERTKPDRKWSTNDD